MEHLKYFIPIYLSVASRLHGGGFVTNVPRIVRSVIYSAPYILLGVPAFVMACIGKNIGHEDFWNMGTAQSRPDKSWLCKLVLLTGLKRDSIPFCWIGMGIKGAIIGSGTLNALCIAGHALALPLSYHISQRTRFKTEGAEFLSGLLCGFSLLTAWSFNGQ